MSFIEKAEEFFYDFRYGALHKGYYEHFSEGCHAWWIVKNVTPKANSDREKKRKSGVDDELNIPATTRHGLYSWQFRIKGGVVAVLYPG